MRIVFRNLRKSELAKELVRDRIGKILDKFPDLRSHEVTVTLLMDNGPQQRGEDSFTVKLFVSGARYRAIAIAKSASNLYAALADVVDHSLERLSRVSERHRVLKRHAQRRRTFATAEA